VVVQDAEILMDLPLHVIVTATRVPEAAARYGAQAIDHGKHLVMIDKEAESVVGRSSSTGPTGRGWSSRRTLAINRAC
jgi:predicted homoserine dehydrogenase-like protein